LLKRRKPANLGQKTWRITQHPHKRIYEVSHHQKDILFWGNKQTFTNQKGALNKLKNQIFKLKVSIQ
jgi:hypothetical protein